MLQPVCGSTQNENVCPPTFDPSCPAGIEALHPMRPDFEEHFSPVGGVGFDDIVAAHWQPIVLPAYLPQVRWRSKLRSERVTTPFVGVRLDAVFANGRVRGAAELREFVGLSANTKLVLLLFSKDDVLEQLASDWDRHLAEIARGGWDLVLPPSFSLWEPQRRPDNLLSLRRSMVAYAALQERDVNTIPRVGWVEPIDMERYALWINANPAVDVVSLDLQTYAARSFDRSVALLGTFDALTGERLRYLVNGVKSYRRIAGLYLATAPERVTITEATTARVAEERTRAGRTLAARAAEVESRCLRVRELIAEANSGLDVEELIRRARAERQQVDSEALAA